MRLERALLEEWMRRYYFETDQDIGSSGVEDFSMAEIRELLGIRYEDLDEIVFHDSQTLGGTGIRQALADRWVDGHADRVMVTHGSTEANYLIMTGLLSAGDEVVVLDPFYQQLYAVAKAMGCELKQWPLRFGNRFRPDFSELQQLVTPRTRMIVVNFPHNPTGVTLTRDEQRELLLVAEKVGAYLVWDGAFTSLTYGAPPLPEPVLEYDRAVSMGTMSKAYGLPGLRVGWCLAAPDVLERFVHLRDYTLLHLSPLVEFIAEKVVVSADRLIGLRLELAKRNLEILTDWMEKNGEVVEWVPPMGGVCAFPRFRRRFDVEAFCHRLAQEYRVLLVPGSCFKAPEHVRLGFGGSTVRLEQGLASLLRCLEATSGSVAGGGAHGQTDPGV